MGLYNRDYMNDRPVHSDAMSGKQMLWILIIINIAAFFIVRDNMFNFFSLTIEPGEKFFQTRYLWEIFTAGFLHDGFFHIFFNMWGLYIFGSLVAKHISGHKMLLLYLLGAASGNILFILFNPAPVYPIQLVGASGAVCAMMAAAATLEPDCRFTMIFMPFTPIKTTTLVICYTIMELVMEFSNMDRGIAHLAHLGGFLGGYIIMLCCFGRNLPWDPLRSISRKLSAPRPRFARPHYSNPADKDKSAARTQAQNQGKVSQKELDYLLDKLSEQGINSLSEYELERLRQARKQMRGEE